MEAEAYDGLAAIPPYDDDVRQQGFLVQSPTCARASGRPTPCWIVTPEYNHSVPGALGTARAQHRLRQMFVFLNGMPLNRPEVMIGSAAQRFDAEGRLADEKTREFVRALLLSLKDWTERLRR